MKWMLLLFLIPFAYAEIDLQTKSSYNLGEQVELLVQGVQENSEAFFEQTEIVCDSSSLTYYRSPVVVGSNYQAQIPSLSLHKSMKGECIIYYKLLDTEDKVIEQKSSHPFIVTDLFNAQTSLENQELKAGQNVKVTGFVRNSRAESDSATLKVILEEQEYTFEVDEEFSVEFALQEDISSGEHRLVTSLIDDKGNYFDNVFDLEIIPSADALDLTIHDDVYLPYEEIKVTVFILDQAQDPMEGSVDLSLSKGSKIIETTTLTDGIYTRALDNSHEPGTYTVEVVHESLKKGGSFDIAAYREVESTLEEGKVTITNVGNAEVENDSIIVLSKGDEEIEVKVTQDLDPGESTEVDLSEHVSEGEYTVLLADGSSHENVALEDNRGFFKKLGSIFSAGPTGNVVSEDGVKGSSLSRLLFFLVLTVIAAIVIYTKSAHLWKN